MFRSLLFLLKHQGPRWLFFRAVYAFKNRIGWFRRRLPCGQWSLEPAGRLRADFTVLPSPATRATLGSDEAVLQADRILGGELSWFSRHQFQAGFPPSWCFNPWGPSDTSLDMRHWSQIAEFSAGDIKGLWEQGRFGFIFPLVRAHARSGDERFVEAFWQAIEDWRAKNPPQCGPHWKCGQEIALRLMAMAFGYMAFCHHPATTPRRVGELAEMIETFGRRIEINIDYALSQKNNHGMSEAAGLFTAGVWLERTAWISRGERLLERLARELIYDDGSFSQHSTNYHRLMLHDYLWAIRLGESAGHPLPASVVERIGKAGKWLLALLAPATGRVPNLGPNDGAHFLDLTDLGYLDFRPTVQAVGLIIEKRRWLPAGSWDELAAWLGVDFAKCELSYEEGSSGTCDDRCMLIEFPVGGYYVWHVGSAMAVLRCPRRFRHRPSQCDLLHFDVWSNGRNLLRDAGSYSYNCEEPWLSYFGDSKAHNTIQCDERNPMPKLSRFLYGDWPRADVQRDSDRVTVSYRDYRGTRHWRRVQPTKYGFLIEDEIDGAFRKAVLRWRLDPSLAWVATDAGCRSDAMELVVHAIPDQGCIVSRITEGWESLYYQERTPVPTLEIHVGEGRRKLVTEIRLFGLPAERAGGHQHASTCEELGGCL